MISESDKEEASYAVRVAKRLKQEEMETIKWEQLLNLNVIPGTSVNCERLFSLAKNILTDNQKCTAPRGSTALVSLTATTVANTYSTGHGPYIGEGILAGNCAFIFSTCPIYGDSSSFNCCWYLKY